jgi:hypothetical protein
MKREHLRADLKEVHDDVLAEITNVLPSFEGNFDPHAYIDWELKVDSKFDEYDLSEKQMIFAASNALTRFALTEWKHICRLNRVPRSWIEFKIHFRDIYIPAYYADLLLTKLEKLSQGSRTVREYYHDFKICVLFGGLDECMEDTMSRFMRGLKSDVQTLLLNETYSHISHLFLLACMAESKTVLTHDELHLSTLHANQENHVAETIPDLPLSQHDSLVVPYDKDELCDTSSLISSPQLEIEHPIFRLVVHNILQEDGNNTIECIEQLHPLLREKYDCPAATPMEESEQSITFDAAITPCYIKLDFLCDLNNLENDISTKSGMPSFNRCSLHAIGKYDNKGEYMVHQIYICSKLKSPMDVQSYDQVENRDNTNRIMPSFPIFALREQVRFQEGEHGWVLAATYPPTVYKPRTVCCQEGENDEDITGSDITLLTTPKLKVNQLYFNFRFDTFEQLLLHHDLCVFSFSELLTWIKGRLDCITKPWKVNEVDWGPTLSIPHVLHHATTPLFVQEKKQSKSNTFWMLDSDCRTTPNRNSHHDFIRTPIGTVQDSLESLSSLLSNGSSLDSISYLRRAQ